MDVSNCWMTLLLLGVLPLQGVLGAVLFRGEDTGELKLFFWPQLPETELVEALGSGPIARSTDLLKRSPKVDFFTTLGINIFILLDNKIVYAYYFWSIDRW